MHDDIDATEASSRVETGAYLLDVRNDDEWEAGHAPVANHLALHALPDNLENLPSDRQIVVICKAGGRSAQATAFLRQSGFNAVNVEGGMLSWAFSGLPVQAESGAPGTVL